jgi:hypothetical protein
VAPYGAGALSTTEASYNIASISWDPGGWAFTYATDYTATIKLTAKQGYKFTDGLKPAVNIGTASNGAIDADAEGNTLTFTVTFPATGHVPAPSVTVSPGSATRAIGENVTITATATSNAYSGAGGTMAYQWYKEGIGQLQGQTTYQLTLSDLTLGDAGKYYCIVYETIGGKTSDGTTSSLAELFIGEPGVVNKSGLESAIAAFIDLLDKDGMPLKDYTPESWNAAKAAYAAAILVRDDEKATQAGVNSAVEALNKAISNLRINQGQNLSIDDNYRIAVEASRAGNDKFIAEYTIHNDSDIDSALIVIAAIYDRQGRMIATVMDSITIPKGGLKSGDVSIAVPAGYNPDDVTMKAFVWEGLSWLPVAYSITFGG